MSRQIPLSAIPSQTANVTLDGQVARITVRTIGSFLYFSLDGVVTNRICRNRQRLLVDAQYHGFVGDFEFVDTQGDSDPQYPGLADRFMLVYFSAGE